MNDHASKAARRTRKGSSSARPAAPAPEAQAADHQVKVALAAYFIAEKRGFEPGHELDDWLAAEVQIAAAGQPSVTGPVQTLKAETLS